MWKEEKSAKGEMDGETEGREKTSIPSQEMMKRGTEWGGTREEENEFVRKRRNMTRKD